MVNFSHGLSHSHRKKTADFSSLDLKSSYRGYRYVCETIKMLLHIVPMFLQEKPDGILLADIFQKIARLGAIHAVSSTADTP
jgi:hypothetical protein